MKKIFVSDLKVGDALFGEVFAVKSFVRKASRQNKPYYDLELVDYSGAIGGKVWSDDFPNVETVTEGDVVSINGTVDEYNGLQLKITNLKKTDDYEISDLQQASKFDVDQMWGDIEKEIEGIKNPNLTKILKNVFTPEFVESFKKAPAAFIVHHAYAGGLLEHTWEMVKMADSIKGHFPKINLDMVKAGCILHDSGKARELKIGTVIEQTDEGKLLGHIYLGAEIVKEASEGVPVELRNEMIHIILSHHGTKEFGSPVVPMTTEAIAINALDQASSKMNMAYGHIHEGLGTDKYTPYIRQLGTELYRSPYSDDEINEDIPF
jgi:3'-5' exoribonuclease